MKKIILLALTALILGGCDEKPSKVKDSVTIVDIDSCEYIHNYTYMRHQVYTHKGNCRFCKERRQKELEELVIKLKEK